MLLLIQTIGHHKTENFFYPSFGKFSHMTVKACRAVLRRSKEQLLSQLLRSVHDFPKEGMAMRNSRKTLIAVDDTTEIEIEPSLNVAEVYFGHKEEEAHGFSFSAPNSC